MAHFFIDRPIFAWVIAIIIMLAGALAYLSLPVAQFPNIAPPQISIRSVYPGASAKTLEDTVTQIIEQQMKGLDHLSYMSSTSDSSGQAETILTFTNQANPDIAQVQVQNKLQLAMPMLPQEVQRQGVGVSKSTRNFLLVISFFSPDGQLASADLANYVAANIQDPVSRLTGVGDITVFGSQYAMRIWCDPEKMLQYKLIPSDIASAVQAQNAQVSGGQIGDAPLVEGQLINMTVIASTRFTKADEFRNILLRTNEDGSSLRLGDVARVELGAQSYSSFSRYNGQAATGLAVKLATGANALATAAAVKAEVQRLSAFFPSGMEYAVAFDTTPFVAISLQEVFKTLVEAVALVFLVMFLFLQDFRTTLIPTIVVPVVLLGTLAMLFAAGFSLNTLTMFAMVLAIGLLVDDAIVVVENVERIMHEEHLSPRDAARKSMSQISGALFGMTTVLTAVFIPMAFFPGSTGVIYRQFSITIVTAMGFSLLMAFILTPALCATMLRPTKQTAQQGFFGRFNRWFNSISKGYQRGVQRVMNRVTRLIILYLALAGVLGYMFVRMPTSFLPDEDQGMLYVSVSLPPGSTFESTLKVLQKVEQHFLVTEKDAVQSIMAVAGFSFSGNGQNNGMCFVRLKDWDLRQSENLKVPAIVQRGLRALYPLPYANIFTFAPPAIMELGTSSGFDFILQDQSGQGHEALMQARNQLLGAASQHPLLRNVRPNGLDDVDQYVLDVDIAKAGAIGVPITSINPTVSAYWGSLYINDFLDSGRTKKVYLQADKDFRMQQADFDRYYIRSNTGDMVPFSSFLSGHISKGSPRLERYNGVSSVEILGEAIPGKSSGVAMLAMEELAGQLPTGFGFSWTGLSYQERMSGALAPALYALSLLIVFLCLAALYESWSIPFSVMLVVPIGVLGALVAANLRGMSNDVYFQVGLLTTIGLSAKNAILIVEFARENEEEGMGLLEATFHAARMRLRPIIMTSMAFILGVLPLAISSGAGSGGQNAIGTGVIGGMLAATTLGLYYIPVFFVVVSRLFKVGKADRPAPVEGGNKPEDDHGANAHGSPQS